MLLPQANNQMVEEQILLANSYGKPLYLVLIATKPCYIKLASMIVTLHKQCVPFLAIDVGQHYEKELIGAQNELHYAHLISVFLNVRGDLLERTSDLTHKVKWLFSLLKEKKLNGQAIPVISGDTSTAGIFPVLWYLKTSVRSIHIEAGLRSYSPFKEGIPGSSQELVRLQRDEGNWKMIKDEPFPEGIDTRLASVCSQLFFAPVAMNYTNLVREGVEETHIYQVGSLSADALSLICQEKIGSSIFEIYPFLKKGSWIRVDIHRRENVNFTALHSILKAVQQLGEEGFKIVIVLSNALKKAIKVFQLDHLLESLQQQENVKITPLWADYRHVIEFLQSGHCRGIYTDSGGLQEETQILDIPCITCRYSTDRPETVLAVHNNLLVPPASTEVISKSLAFILGDRGFPLFSNNTRQLYNVNVAARIVGILDSYVPVSTPVVQDIFDNSIR